ncbi:hypothetical protein [Nocardia brevicatena]|uniref:hypothetical protein n=1 Tax=Nocardia brevicatena TaxID=37327 RepID=UPI000594385E|nr:hypothetical protein [Nocardia brevicatena]
MPENEYVYGDFNYRTVTGAFANDLSRIRSDERHFGLEQQIEYVYGFLNADDGSTICLEQKFVGSVSTGTFVMRTDGRGGLNVQPETTRSYRGEVRRTFTETSRRWADPVMLRLPDSVRRPDDLPYLLELEGDSLLWDQGSLCHLEGEVKTLGVQFYAASAVEPLFFSSIPYWVEGTVLNRQVNGLLYFDRVYLKPGTEWKETAMFTDVQISWNIFGNKLSDGSIEYGKIVVGRDGFNAGMVVENNRLVASSSVVPVRYRLNDAGFVRTATYGLGDHEWVFEGNDEGNMAEFSASRWNGYHAQFGITRRKGDDRERISGFTWLESFDHRMRDAGLVDN